jgi:hypothetical protein
MDKMMLSRWLLGDRWDCSNALLRMQHHSDCSKGTESQICRFQYYKWYCQDGNPSVDHS